MGANEGAGREARTVVITGASDGIGAAAARALKAGGDEVVLVGRSPDKTARLADELGAPHHVADFADLSQVRDLAAALREQHPTIDVLINNAGAIVRRFERTVDGHEKTVQVNHLAPFLLTNLLIDVLEASSAIVITTSSDSASFGRVDLATFDPADGARFDSKTAYGDSKLDNVLFTSELQQRHGGNGIRAVAFHPGTVASNFGSDTTTIWAVAYRTPLRHVVLTTPEKAAQHVTWLLDDTSTWTPGLFYLRRKPKVINPQAEDAALASQLWDRSAELVGLVPAS